MSRTHATWRSAVPTLARAVEGDHVIKLRVLATAVLTAILALTFAPAASAAPTQTEYLGFTIEYDPADPTAGFTILEANSFTTATGYAIIPRAEIDGVTYALTGIGNGAYANRGFSVEPVLPETITWIGDNAFAGNPITSVTLPSGLTTIGDRAFFGSELTDVRIPATVTSIGDYAFQGAYPFDCSNAALAASCLPFIDEWRATTPSTLESVSMLGPAPTTGNLPFGAVTETAAGPLISYYARYQGSGYTTPTWTTGGADYRSHALGTLSFDAGGLVADPAPIDLEIGQLFPVSTLPTLESSSHDFVGWTTTVGNTTVLPDSISFALTEDYTFYAVWELKSYDVTFSYDNGDADTVVPTDHGSTVAEPADDPTRTGYTFTGWKFDDSLYDFATPVTEAITLEAGWLINTYDVTFDPANGGGTTVVPTDHGDTVAEPADDPAYDGHTFTGWQLDGSPYDFNAPVTGPITLAAGWNLNTYDVTFQFGNGDADIIVPTDHGFAVVAPPQPTRAGYTFAGWQLEGVDFRIDAAIKRALTLVAAWEDIPAQASAPDTGDEGGQITVTGSGFTPEGGIEVWLNSDPVLLGRFVADPTGAFDVRIVIPTGTPAGEHTLVVTDGVETVEMPFEVIAAPVVVEPTRGETADTGADVMPTLIGAGSLLLAGFALVALRRRSDYSQ